jgi:hypothetical protein
MSHEPRLERQPTARVPGSVQLIRSKLFWSCCTLCGRKLRQGQPRERKGDNRKGHLAGTIRTGWLK